MNDVIIEPTIDSLLQHMVFHDAYSIIDNIFKTFSKHLLCCYHYTFILSDLIPFIQIIVILIANQYAQTKCLCILHEAISRRTKENRKFL